MTVAEIKDYIDYQITKCTVINDKGNVYYDKIGINNSLEKIKSILDELEPKAKWTNNMNGTFTCSRCGAKRPNDNYCGNCGARMNDELKENNK